MWMGNVNAEVERPSKKAGSRPSSESWRERDVEEASEGEDRGRAEAPSAAAESGFFFAALCAWSGLGRRREAPLLAGPSPGSSERDPAAQPTAFSCL